MPDIRSGNRFFDGFELERRYTDGRPNVDAEPPKLVVEGPAPCSASPGVQAMLQQSLARARAPAPGWVVSMRIAAGAHGLGAEGRIADAAGRTVAERSVGGSASDCSALAEALGVWAALVLDAEMKRLEHPAVAAPPAPAPEPDPADATPPPPAEDGSDVPLTAAASREPDSPELELGGFVTAQTSDRPLAGVTPSVVLQAASGVVVRSALLIGASLPGAGPANQWAAARADGCARWLGLYAKGHGLEFDLCGGAEAGVVHDFGSPLDFYFALGPSADLGGEFGERVSAVLRGVAGANLTQGGLSGRFEVALSWRTQ
jgi:hypothetical protein